MDPSKRVKKKDHSGLLALVVLVAIFAGVAFLVASPAQHTAVQPQTQSEDAFYGTIENARLQAQTTGTVKADTNCKPVQNGLTNCIGIIMASDGTELHFNYTHNMMGQACLSSGDRVTIIPQSDGTVKVVRG